MHIEFLVNGSVKILLSPENDMEEALLKSLMKQENDLTEIRSSVVVLNKTFKTGVLIGKKGIIGNSPDQKSEKEQECGSDDKK